MKRSSSIMMALMLSLMLVYMSVVADGKNKPLSEEVSRTPQIVFFTKEVE
jgi:hypothetical protein